MNNKERINMIEGNMEYSKNRYAEGEISREQLDRLNKDGSNRIKELKI